MGKKKQAANRPVPANKATASSSSALGVPPRWLRIAVFSLLGLMLLTSLIVVTSVLMRTGSSNVDLKGESIGSGFYVYDKRIYVEIPSGGSYLLANADFATFKPSWDGYERHPLGQDKNAVYCGNVAIDDLRPDSLRYVKDGYVSDGTHAYFCGIAESNPDYRWWQEIFGSHDENDVAKVKPYYNKLVQIADVRASALHEIIFEYAADDRNIYYRGELIKGSDAASAQIVTYDYHGERKHYLYLKDKTGVYYRGQRLPNAAPASFETFEPDGATNDEDYGYDRQSGRFYSRNEIFPDQVDSKDTRSLRLLLANRAHADHDLFFNHSGIYFWNTGNNRLERACDLPFASENVQEVANAIFSDGQSLFVTAEYEVWARSRGGGGGLVSRNTVLYRSKDIDPRMLQHIGQVVDESQTEIGALWLAGEQVLFTPRFTQGNGWRSALYRVTDEAIIRQAKAAPQSASAHFQFSGKESSSFYRNESRLTPIDGMRACEASTDYRSTWGRWWWVALIALFIIAKIADVYSKAHKAVRNTNSQNPSLR